jgi:hypothetical protein
MRTIPSPKAVREFLELFHEEDQKKLRQPHTAFIPAAKKPLDGLVRSDGDFVAGVQRGTPEKTATLDMNATLVETHKKQALYCYKKHEAYQPLNIYWAEQGLVVLSEFRDGNVSANFDRDNVLMHVDDTGKSLCLAEFCPALATITDGQEREAEVYLHHKEGYRLPVLARISPIGDGSGNITGAVEVFRDMCSCETPRCSRCFKCSVLPIVMWSCGRLWMIRPARLRKIGRTGNLL